MSREWAQEKLHGSKRTGTRGMSWLWEGRRNREEAGVVGRGTGLLRVGTVSSCGGLRREKDFEFLLLFGGKFECISPPEMRHGQMNPALPGE